MKYNDNGEYKDIYIKSFDTLPVGTEVDYDGETVPTGWTEVPSTNLIVANLTTTQTITISSAYSLKKIPLDNEYLKIGNKLTFDSTNNCIKIGTGVNHIEVSAMAVCDTFSNTSIGERELVLSKNTGWNIQNNLVEALPTGSRRTFTIPNTIIQVEENDEISLKMTSYTAETFKAIGDNTLKVYLVVKVID